MRESFLHSRYSIAEEGRLHGRKRDYKALAEGFTHFGCPSLMHPIAMNQVHQNLETKLELLSNAPVLRFIQTAHTIAVMVLA